MRSGAWICLFGLLGFGFALGMSWGWIGVVVMLLASGIYGLGYTFNELNSGRVLALSPQVALVITLLLAAIYGLVGSDSITYILIFAISAFAIFIKSTGDCLFRDPTPQQLSY